MSSIRFDGVAFAYSDAIPLFHDISLTLERGFTGIVGANGAGKSTLLRLISGALPPTRGTITKPPLIAVCAQTIDEIPDGVDAVAGRLRSQLGLDPDQLARWSTLSPGERRRWQLGAALAAEPDALLLDEPTNHVDRECRTLLVAALRRFTGIGVIVSHDRALLDELTTATLRIDHTATLYPGNYTTAQALWQAGEQRARDVRDDARTVAKRATQKLAAVRREQAHAEAGRRVSKHKKNHKDHDCSSMGATVVGAWAEARWGRAVEVARRERDRAEAAVPDAQIHKELGRSIFVEFERAPRRWLFELTAPVIRAGDHPVLHDVRVAVGNTDRIRITGPNGAGKTTLISALLESGPRPDRSPPRPRPEGAALLAAEGPPSEGPTDRVLVLPQELDPDAGPRLVGELRAAREDVRGRTLQLVAALGADPDRILASAAPSPGEARKLQLALGLASHAWAVVLDEPTNHFDLPSIERLEVALAAYPGALVLVSHDDRFAERSTTRTWRLDRGKVVVE